MHDDNPVHDDDQVMAAGPSPDRDGRHAARVLALGMGILFSVMLLLNALAS